MFILHIGLLTQTDYCDGVTLDGICDHFLRMILERSMKFVPKLNVNNYVNKDELVQYLHENAGDRVQSTLRYWSFMIQVMRQLILDREYSLNQFQQILKLIKDQNLQMNGLLPFCFEINSECEKYLNDSILAEYILTTADLDDKKFTILTTSILSTNNNNNTPNLDQVLINNIERIEKLQNELNIITTTIQEQNRSEDNIIQEQQQQGNSEIQEENVQQSTIEDKSISEQHDENTIITTTTNANNQEVCKTGKKELDMLNSYK
ncbi:unnamed protein product [Rotaria sp. Silwood1]|nr:unnamed protein product [Rotaria sp. Silwood1]